jgi:hypothetical protein
MKTHNKHLTEASPLLLLSISSIVLHVIEHNTHKEQCEYDNEEEYKEGLVICALSWPYVYSRLFPEMFKHGSTSTVALGALAPSMYMAWISTHNLSQDPTSKKSISESFGKDAVVGTAMLLMNAIGTRSKSENATLRICLSMALMSALLGADLEDDRSSTARASVATAMRIVSLFTCVSVTLAAPQEEDDGENVV